MRRRAVLIPRRLVITILRRSTADGGMYMQNTNTLCMGCMKDIGENDICPHCGHHDDGLQTAPYLPLRTWLKDRYLVGNMADNNGEGNTYIGWDNVSQAAVLIREYMPCNLCERAENGLDIVPQKGCASLFAGCLQSFLELARALARMRDLSALLPVYDIFELYGTAYYVSEKLSSISLEEFLQRNGGKLNWEQTKALMMPVLTTLRSLHSADIIHRGISPETVIVGRDGKLRLTGFCIAAARTARSEINSQLYPGYSAIEQYGFEGQQGAWTDIYAFAACVFRILTGTNPPEATERVTNDLLVIPTAVAESLPKYVLTTLANALQILPNDRTKSVDIFHNEIANVSAIIGRQATTRFSVAKKPGEPEKKEGKPKGATWKYIVVSLVCTAIILGLGTYVIYRQFIYTPDEEPPVSFFSVPSESSKPAPSSAVATEVVLDLVGKTYQEATVACKNRFEVIVVGKQYSNLYEKGKIISQEPAGNANIAVQGNAGQYNRISVILSLGRSTVTMPDLTNLSYEEAFIKLVTLGFSPENIIKAEKYSIDVNPEKVVDTVPIIGSTSVSVDGIVTLYLNNRTETSSRTGGEVISTPSRPGSSSGAE